MSKLIKLKEWLTIEDTAKRLSISAGETVSEADVLRLVLEGHLTVSVYFVNRTVARRGEIVAFDDTNWTLVPPLFNTPGVRVSVDDHPPTTTMPWKLQKLLRENPEFEEQGLMPLMTSLAARTGEEQYINLEEDIFHIASGVWDLPLMGNEYLSVEDAYQQKTKGPSITIQGINGAFICDGAHVYQLQERDEENPDMAGSHASFKWISQLIHGNKKSREEAKNLIQKHNEDREPVVDESTQYYPAGGLPDDSVLVVRTGALRELEEKLLADDFQPDKPLHSSERKSAGQIIAALSAMAKLDLSTPYAADETLRAAAASNGLELPSSPGTVVKFLKDAAARAGKA
ncbi:hypothetical protein PMI29_00267 [Pseudomonas sp. GM49]|uniref:hypothetical protein n=1 Tax=Pseudomonas sp. GM49 TaxID=1144331 RepID=UPI0002709978|nr:hypothetical protein [Pseudomonas sp. GM49]EJM75741.1 hypothetical protein PMI29_00267 [Pseudomonas sp. GM49]